MLYPAILLHGCNPPIIRNFDINEEKESCLRQGRYIYHRVPRGKKPSCFEYSKLNLILESIEHVQRLFLYTKSYEGSPPLYPNPNKKSAKLATYDIWQAASGQAYMHTNAMRRLTSSIIHCPAEWSKLLFPNRTARRRSLFRLINLYLRLGFFEIQL